MTERELRDCLSGISIHKTSFRFLLLCQHRCLYCQLRWQLYVVRVKCLLSGKYFRWSDKLHSLVLCRNSGKRVAWVISSQELFNIPLSSHVSKVCVWRINVPCMCLQNNFTLPYKGSNFLSKFTWRDAATQNVLTIVFFFFFLACMQFMASTQVTYGKLVNNGGRTFKGKEDSVGQWMSLCSDSYYQWYSWLMRHWRLFKASQSSSKLPDYDLMTPLSK